MHSIGAFTMKENLLIDLSKQFAVDVVNLCTNIKENRKSNILLNKRKIKSLVPVV